MELRNLVWQVEEGVGVLTVSRPQALNALDVPTLRELDAFLAGPAREPSLRALVVTGAGPKAFVAGADVPGLAGMRPVDAHRFSELGGGAVARLEALPIPTIAAVNGFALGGGLELALACDLAYAAEGAWLGLPEVKLGLIPGFGGTQRLARRVGAMRALELLLTGDPVDAARALALGLVAEVLPPAELLPRALAVARTVAARGPLAVAAAKRVLRGGLGISLAEGCALEREAFAALFATDDAREGVGAFLEKRPAAFRGS